MIDIMTKKEETSDQCDGKLSIELVGSKKGKTKHIVCFKYLDDYINLLLFLSSTYN